MKKIIFRLRSPQEAGQARQAGFTQTPVGGAGFTLVELLVVIAIIGLLSALAVVALNNARLKSRDAKRVADARQISMAVALYYNDCREYPSDLVTTIDNGCDEGETFGLYMASIPSDPQSPAREYVYDSPGPDYYTYTFTVTTEGNVSGIGDAGPHTVTPAGFK